MTLKQKIERRNTPEQIIVAAHELWGQHVDPDYGPYLKRVGKRWFRKEQEDRWREASEEEIDMIATVFLATRAYDDEGRGQKPRLPVNSWSCRAIMHALKILAYRES